MKKTYVFFLIFYGIITSTYSFANTITSKGTGINGLWDQPSSWTGGVQPGINDTVEILAGDTVTVNGNNTIRISKITVKSFTGKLIVNNSFEVSNDFIVEAFTNVDLYNTVTIHGDLYNDGTITTKAFTFLWVYNNLNNNGNIGNDLLSLIIGNGPSGKQNVITGSGRIGSLNNPIYNFTLYDSLDFQLVINGGNSDSIYTKSLDVHAGLLKNSQRIVLGDGDYATLRIGYPYGQFPDAILDNSPRWNITDNNVDISYTGFKDNHITGFEVPPSKTIHNLTIEGFVNSPSNIILGDNLTVNGDIYFQSMQGENRRLILGNNNLFCGGSITGASKTTGYIVTDGNGTLQRPVVPGSSLVFPIGVSTTSYDSMRLSFTSGSQLDTFGVRVGANFTNQPLDITKTVKREWNITENTPGNDTATILLTYDENAPTGNNYNAMNPIVMGHYESGHWTEESASLFGVTAGYAVTTSHPYTSFSPFAVGNAGSLPITLSSIIAERRNNAINIVWSTFNEQNNKGFELQRSKDGIHFTTLQFVPSKAQGGSSTSLINYSYNDASPLSGTNYYRLKQIDFNGETSYSNTVLVKGNKILGVNIGAIYPNPVGKMLNLSVEAATQNDANILITDMSGKVMLQQKKILTAGENNISINANTLSTGNYLIKIISKDGYESSTSKFIKE